MRIDEHDLRQRHIGTDNVVRGTKCWLMIDCELARRTGHVWCEGKAVARGQAHVQNRTLYMQKYCDSLACLSKQLQSVLM